MKYLVLIINNLFSLINEFRLQYSMHEVSVFDDDAKFLDIIGTLLNQTVQSSAFTVIFMLFVCFLFIPQITAVIIATFSILSIFIGKLKILFFKKTKFRIFDKWMKGYVLNEIINKIWIKLKRNRIDRKKNT